MNISLEVGLRIRYYRKEKHITQEKLAEICNLHPTYIGQLERGEKNATIESLYKITSGLGISMGKLLENIECPEDEHTSIPLHIYHQILSLPVDKQQKIQTLINDMIDLIQTKD